MASGVAELFRDGRFVRFFLSSSAGDAGYALYAVSVVWIAIRLSGGPLLVGLVLAVETGVYALSFLTGPIVDRARNLRDILLVGYSVQGALAGLLALLVARNALTGPTLLAFVVPISVAWDFTWTATNAIPPKIVPTDRLFLANWLESAVSGGNQVAGYAAGAALILVVGPSAGAAAYAVLNGVAALAVIGLLVPSGGSPGAFGEKFREGWHYLLREAPRALRSVVAFSAAQAFFSTGPLLLIVVLANDRFPAPAQSYAILVTAFSLGSLVGGLLLGPLNPRERIAALLVGATAAEGVALAVAVELAPALVPSAIAWFAVGLLDVAVYPTVLTYVQAIAPPALVGRTVSNTYLFRGSSRATGSVVLGTLASVIALPTFGLVVALVFFAVAAIGPLALRDLRSARF